MTENGEKLSRDFFNLAWISGVPSTLDTLEDVWNSGREIFHLRLYFSWYLPARTANVIKPNCSCYYVQKGHGFRENLASVIVSTFLIFMFVDQLLLVDVFSQLYYLTYAKKQQCRTYRYKSLKSRKIDNIDLTQQFSLSISTDFRYQSIKSTWLLSIFIDWPPRVQVRREMMRFRIRLRAKKKQKQKQRKKSQTREETIMLKANQIAGITNDFKMDIINKRVPWQP